MVQASPTKVADSNAQAPTSLREQEAQTFDLQEPDVFVVEAIRGVKRAKRTRQFLVKWQGYDELTWEPERHLPRDLVASFLARRKQPPRRTARTAHFTSA